MRACLKPMVLSSRNSSDTTLSSLRSRLKFVRTAAAEVTVSPDRIVEAIDVVAHVVDCSGLDKLDALPDPFLLRVAKRTRPPRFPSKCPAGSCSIGGDFTDRSSARHRSHAASPRPHGSRLPSRGVSGSPPPSEVVAGAARPVDTKGFVRLQTPLQVALQLVIAVRPGMSGVSASCGRRCECADVR